MVKNIYALMLFCPILIFSQNEEQIKKIREETNLENLRKLKEMRQKSSMSEKELKKKAKELNIPYKYVSGGRDYQLSHFESDGKPVYLVTQQSTTPKKDSLGKKKSCFFMKK